MDKRVIGSSGETQARKIQSGFFYERPSLVKRILRAACIGRSVGRWPALKRGAQGNENITFAGVSAVFAVLPPKLAGQAATCPAFSVGAL
jgi:hypothetical protein